MTAAPTTDRGRATREQILEAASELFYRQGVTATGLDQIVAASGTGKGQLYHYFAGKRDLTHAVIERQIASIMADQQPRLDALATPADLRRWADALVEGYAEGDHPLRCPLGALAAELAESDPDARDALERGFGRWTEALAAGLTRLQAQGELPASADPARLAGALLSAYQGGLLLAQVRGDASPLRDALEVALRGVTSGPVR
jgi:TetR/AcrR family transcriptional repressor of nem operon